MQYDCKGSLLLAVDCVKAYYPYSVVIEIGVNIELCRGLRRVYDCSGNSLWALHCVQIYYMHPFALKPYKEH